MFLNTTFSVVFCISKLFCACCIAFIGFCLPLEAGMFFRGELEEFLDEYVSKPPYNPQRAREKVRAFLEQNQNQGSAVPLKYDPRGNSQLLTYMEKHSKLTRGAQFYAILQALNFVERNQKHKRVERQRGALIALCQTISVVGYHKPPPYEKPGFERKNGKVPEWQLQERVALRLLLEAGWLTPYFGTELVEKDEKAAEYFVRDFEHHIREARLSGKKFYPYACWQSERFIPKYYAKRPVAQARLYFRLSWMYLHLEEYNKAKVAARKIPKISGMEEAGDRFIKYADEELKKRRSRRK